MKKRIILASLVAVLLALAYSGVCAAYDKTLTLTKSVLESAGATRLELSIDLGAAKVTLVPSTDTENVVVAEVTYSDPRLEPTLTTSITGSKFIAQFRSGVITGQYPPNTQHEWVITIGAYDIDTDLALNLGGVSGDFDLGGMPLVNFTGDLGGVQMGLDFSASTTRSVQNVLLNCGGSYLTATNLGNSDFTKFVMNSGGAYTSLDFGGSYADGVHTVVMNLGGSAAEVLFPQDAGEHLRGIPIAALMPVSGDGWQQLVFRPFYRELITTDYDTQPVKIDAKITAAASSVYVDRVP